MKRIVLVSCSKTKRDETALARDLYDPSIYFRLQREYAEAVSDRWFILSAKHGLTLPIRWLSPYDRTISDISNLRFWAERVAISLENYGASRNDVIEILAGRDYSDPLIPEIESLIGADVIEPLRGKRIGDRQAWLKAKIEEWSE